MGLSLGSKIARMATPPVPAGTLETSALVEAARGGDRFAFGQLYGRYARMVHGILLARVPHAEVEDLVHDVFLLALNRLAQLRQPAAFGGWLAQIARNRAHDFHRRPQGFIELQEEFRGAPDADRMETLAALAAIRALPEAYRETLILRLVEGMSGPEIAERTGLTPGSVRVNLHRGMKQLREHLARSSGHE